MDTAVRFGERAVSYAELAIRVRKLVSVLSEFGVGKGDKVALISCNCLVHIELIFACARLNAVCVLCNVRLSLRGLVVALQDTTLRRGGWGV